MQVGFDVSFRRNATLRGIVERGELTVITHITDNLPRGIHNRYDLNSHLC